MTFYIFFVYISSKRRNQSARTVISADPSVRSDELVIPPEFAKNLTMPVLVSKLNIEYVQKIVDQGKANFVIKPNKTTRINLKYAMNKKSTPILWGDKIQRGNVIINPHAEFGKRDFELREGDIILRQGERITDIEVAKKKPYKIEIGDLVERHLMDNDIALFNQQHS